MKRCIVGGTLEGSLASVKSPSGAAGFPRVLNCSLALVSYGFMLESLPAPAVTFELFAENQLIDGFFVAGHLALARAADASDVDAAKRLVKTAAHLLAPSQLGAVYAYAATNQIELILRPPSLPSPRALLAHLSAAASAKHSLLGGSPTVFDARLYEFPQMELLRAYFRGKQEEAEARLLDEMCARAMASAGEDPGLLAGMRPDEKREILEIAGTRWDEVPKWRRRGVGLYRGEGEELVVDTDVPSGDDYSQFLSRFL